MGVLPLKAGGVQEAILDRGELPRSDVAGILGTSDRQARRVVAARWMPGMFPEQEE